MANKETRNTKMKRLDADTPPRPIDIDPIPEPAHQTKGNKVLNWLVVVALVLAALGIARILTWSLDNTQVLEIKNAPFPTRTIREHPTAGGVIILDVDYCKNKDLQGEVRTSFVSSSREVFLPVSEENLPVGCRHDEVPVLIPKDIPADTYKIKFRVTYKVNPLKQSKTNTFESREVIVDPTTPQ